MTLGSISRRGVALASALLLVSSFVGLSAASAGSMPSGQRTIGNVSFSTATMTFSGGGSTIEPAYDDATGKLVFLSTPTNAKVHPNAHNVAPLYLPVYPIDSTIDPATFDCAHTPADNCPDHGPAVAGAVMGIPIPPVHAIYGGGVLGHDHLVGIASTGGDFNIIWEPTLVLFLDHTAAVTQHITTLAQINADLAAGLVITVPLPQLDFNCARVSAAVYAHGTPAPTVVGP